MALRSSLRQVIEMAREEARLSTNTSRGTDHLASVRRKIKRHYEMLADEHDWQHLTLVEADAIKALSAGERYYDFPVALNPNKVGDHTYYRMGSTAGWIEMDYGIGPDDYSGFDSSAGDRSDPALKWQMVSTAEGVLQFEVWPVPSDNSAQIRFTGQRKVRALVDDDSLLDLDDVMISLFVASELLQESKQPDAEAKARAASARLLQQKSSMNSKQRIRVGMNDPNTRPSRGHSIIYVRG
jgi:hypothetical protein